MQKSVTKSQESKPGYLTTEFWKSLIYATLSLLTGVGVISPGLPDKYKAVIDAAAFIAGSICVAAYSTSRGKAKAGTPTLIDNEFHEAA